MTTIILPGREVFERGRRLVNSMVNAPPNLDGFGGAVVSVFDFGPGFTESQISPIIHHLMRSNQARYTNQEDSDTDFRILLEAVIFSARALQHAWSTIAPPHLGYGGWTFVRWMDVDIVINRR